MVLDKLSVGGSVAATLNFTNWKHYLYFVWSMLPTFGRNFKQRGNSISFDVFVKTVLPWCYKIKAHLIILLILQIIHFELHF